MARPKPRFFDAERFARDIRVARGGDSLRSFARYVGMSNVTLCLLEKGSRNVSTELFMSLCAQLDLSPADYMRSERG